MGKKREKGLCRLHVHVGKAKDAGRCGKLRLASGGRENNQKSHQKQKKRKKEAAQTPAKREKKAPTHRFKRSMDRSGGDNSECYLNRRKKNQTQPTAQQKALPSSEKEKQGRPMARGRGRNSRSGRHAARKEKGNGRK